MQKSKKKMCQTDEKKRRGAEVFSTPFFLSIPFPNQNPHQRARAHSIGALLNISFLLFFLRFFVFLSPKRSIHSSRTSRWSRARACIYISRNARSRRVSLERRDEKKREKERKRERDDDPRGKREEEEERSNRFFGAVVCVRASEDERKRERKQDFPLLFERFSKGALRAEFLFSHSLSLTLVRSCL